MWASPWTPGQVAQVHPPRLAVLWTFAALIVSLTKPAKFLCVQSSDSTGQRNQEMPAPHPQAFQRGRTEHPKATEKTNHQPQRHEVQLHHVEHRAGEPLFTVCNGLIGMSCNEKPVSVEL